MSRIRLLACLTAAAAALVTIPAVAPGKGPTKQDGARQAERLRSLERARLAALVDADVARAGPMHAADFELINPAGEVLTADDMLRAVAAGALDFQVYDPVGKIAVRLHGKTAALRYRSNIDLVLAGVGRMTHPAWHTVLYEKRKGRWQIVWEQTTSIGPLAAPVPLEVAR
jgi:hypothetical protein